MVRNFTLPLSYKELETADTDIIADAFGYEYQFHDLLKLFPDIILEPDQSVVNDLLDKYYGS
jgi:hypothetical protein